MSVCVEKEEVLKQIDYWLMTGEYKYSNATHYLKKRIVSIKPKSEWVSVNDKLPEQYTDVIVLYDIGRVGVNWTNKENEFVEHAYCKVTHWMPLPEPPESEGEE